MLALTCPSRLLVVVPREEIVCCQSPVTELGGYCQKIWCGRSHLLQARIPHPVFLFKIMGPPWQYWQMPTGAKRPFLLQTSSSQEKHEQ